MAPDPSPSEPRRSPRLRPSALLLVPLAGLVALRAAIALVDHLAAADPAAAPPATATPLR